MGITLINRRTALLLRRPDGQAITAKQLQQLIDGSATELMLDTGAKLVLVPWIGAVKRRYAISGYAYDGSDRNLDQLTGATP